MQFTAVLTGLLAATAFAANEFPGHNSRVHSTFATEIAPPAYTVPTFAGENGPPAYTAPAKIFEDPSKRDCRGASCGDSQFCTDNGCGSTCIFPDRINGICY